ncbi:hypothetical protein AY599_10500 [Leptolyngbya valderiana BDU 20041]|nr:type II secretion system protein [Geitlerinema sp. CS-897]OAB61985.1 hypothetical protein AY599_10500 [Leptolyngbya valderiana BDU 20041]PPT08388.1 Type II secretory pathway pseudopilin PulG [Geitlerinema sp. FC II]
MYSRSRSTPISHDPRAGFTIVELLVVIVMAGILAAIAAPGWLAFVNRQRINSTTDAALQIMRTAQSRAVTENRAWEASFREVDGQLQGAAHPVETSEEAWQTLVPEASDRVFIERSYTDLVSSTCKAGDFCVQFQDRGIIADDWLNEQTGDDDRLGRITFAATDNPDGTKRCVVVATILGTIRIDRDDGCE